jgi:GT2 family glycosyltransferase
MKKNEVDLSIVIINFGNTKEFTLDCIDSIGSHKNIEIILVDNLSTDGLDKEIKHKYPHVSYLRRDKAYTFGQNNNFGFRHSSGRYVLFLNNDTKIIDNKMFDEIIGWMDKNKKVGVVTCSLVNQDGSYQGTGGGFPSLLRVFMWMTFLDDLPLLDKIVKPFHPMHSFSPLGSNKNYYMKIQNLDWVTAAFYFVRSEVFNKVGGFDDDYDAYMEETDLSFKINKLGYENRYLPNWKIIHFGNISYGNENSLLKELKNILVFYKKHYPKWHLPILKAIIRLGCILRIIVFGVLRPNLAKIYAKAIKQI